MSSEFMDMSKDKELFKKLHRHIEKTNQHNAMVRMIQLYDAEPEHNGKSRELLKNFREIIDDLNKLTDECIV
jgi:hypothetical protein